MQKRIAYVLVCSLSQAKILEGSLGLTISSWTHDNVIPADHQSIIFVLKHLFKQAKNTKVELHFQLQFFKLNHN